jgi:hypothetical protein
MSETTCNRFSRRPVAKFFLDDAHVVTICQQALDGMGPENPPPPVTRTITPPRDRGLRPIRPFHQRRDELVAQALETGGSPLGAAAGESRSLLAEAELEHRSQIVLARPVRRVYRRTAEGLRLSLDLGPHPRRIDRECAYAVLIARSSPCRRVVTTASIPAMSGSASAGLRN